jgi:membrane protein
MLWKQLRETFDHWREDDGPTLAAAVAYYAVFSLFPLLLLLLAAMGFALRFSSGAQNARQQLLAVVAQNTSPALAGHVQAVLDQVSGRATLGGPVALLALLLAAIGVFGQIETAFDRIWRSPPGQWQGISGAILNALYFRLRAFLMLLGAAALVLLALAAGIAVSTARSLTTHAAGGWAWRLAEIAVSAALFWLFFTLLYKSLPKVRVRWSDAARGGLLAALLWEATRQLLACFFVGESYTAYGVVGSLIAVMLWIYVASSILFLGAEHVRVLGQHRRGGGSQVPTE